MEEFLAIAIPFLIGGFVLGYRHKIGRYEEIIDSHIEFLEKNSTELEKIGITLISNYRKKGKGK